MKTYPITLVLKDSSRGYEISPARVPASVLAEFSKDVLDFIKGVGRQDVSSIEVSIIEGSLTIVADRIPFSSVFRDLKTIELNGDLSRIDSKRREIIEKWQSRAKKTQDVTVRIATQALSSELVISRSSDYKDLGTARLVNVELVSFVEYAPKFNKKDMENLVAKGRQAWADVDDPAEWVRSVRGGH